MSHVVVIGAGQAGASLVAKLRKDGFEGEITLIGAEPVPPYQRLPLSKGYLLGDMALERMFLRPESFYAEQDIALKLSDAAIMSLGQVGFDPVYGARPLKRAIQDKLETPIAAKILAGDFGPDSVIKVDEIDGKLDFIEPEINAA